VKTRTSREYAELFSLLSSFDGDCHSDSFVIQRNRDKPSTRKFDVGVFTQPGTQSRHSDRVTGVDYALRISVGTAASSKHPDDRMALIAACEAANDAAAVQTVLIVLGEIPPNKLLEVFH